MSAATGPTAFAYAILQAVPSIPRDERLNVGVVLFCRQLDYLELKAGVPEEKLGLIAPEADLAEIRERLNEICGVIRGEARGGALARMDPSDRFGWLVAPSSTVIQSTAAHAGLTGDPAGELERLYEQLVS